MGQRAAISLTSEEESTLRQWARAGTSEHRLVERAKVILLLNQGKGNAEIASELKTRPARVSKWRQRFARKRLDGLKDAGRKGRPSTYDQATDKRVLTLLDERPPGGCSSTHSTRAFCGGFKYSPTISAALWQVVRAT